MISSIKYQILKDEKIIYVHVKGHLKAQHIIDYIDRLSQDSAYQPGFDELVNLLDVTHYDVDSEEMRAVVDKDMELMANEMQPARCCLVSDQDFVYGMLRMYQIMSEGSGVEITTKRSLVEGAAWLGIFPQYLEIDLWS